MKYLSVVAFVLIIAGYAYANTYERRITCESWEGKYNSCDVDGRIVSARLISQYSDDDCRRGFTWGIDRDYLWVDNGCRGQFEVIVSNGHMHPTPAPAPAPVFVTCWAQNMRGQRFQATGVFPLIVQQRAMNACQTVSLVCNPLGCDR